MASLPMLPPMMAVQQEGVGQDLALTTDTSMYPPALLPSSPDPSSLSPGPVSPGKKRVRISDSTSVRVIEDDGPRKGSDSDNNNTLHASSPRARRELRFSDSAGEEKEYWREYDGSAATEYTELLRTVEQLTFPEEAPPPVVTR